MTLILLDGQSTVNMLSNENLLTNISDSKRNLILQYHAGKAVISKKGDLRDPSISEITGVSTGVGNLSNNKSGQYQ